MQRAGLRPAAAGAAKVLDLLGHGLTIRTQPQQHRAAVSASLGIVVLDKIENAKQGSTPELRSQHPDSASEEPSTSSTPTARGYGTPRGFAGLSPVAGVGRGAHSRAGGFEEGRIFQSAQWLMETGIGGIRHNTTGQDNFGNSPTIFDGTSSSGDGASTSAAGGIAAGGIVGDSLTTEANAKFSPPQLKISVEAKKTFDRIWKEVETEMGGRKSLMIPKEIVWLNGAPGAGKGVNTPFILKTRGFGTKAIQVSDLLDENPETVAIMRSGGLVQDSTVLELLLRQIMKVAHHDHEHAATDHGEAPAPVSGVLVDGFPRTKLQVDFVKLLYDKLMHLHHKYLNTPIELQFPRPIFRIAVLYVEEEESVRRQLSRGKAAIIHNQRVQDSGFGELRQVRPTDLSAKSARRRYQIFREHYDTLLRLKSFFPFHLIDAMGTLNECRDQIGEELQYQSALELDETTFRAISHIPLASDIAQSARQNMVSRLDSYEKHDHETFKAAVELIDEEIIPAIRARALSGLALYNTENPLYFQHPVMAEMVADILSERGYFVTWQTKLRDVPVKIDPITNEILCMQRRTLCFRIKFERPTIRLADHAEEAHVYDHVPAEFYEGGNVTFSSYPSHHLPCFYTQWTPPQLPPSPPRSPLAPDASSPSLLISPIATSSPRHHPAFLPPASRFASLLAGAMGLGLTSEGSLLTPLTEMGCNGKGPVFVPVSPWPVNDKPRIGVLPAQENSNGYHNYHPHGLPLPALPVLPFPRPLGMDVLGSRLSEGPHNSRLEGLHGFALAPHFSWVFPRSFRRFSDV